MVEQSRSSIRNFLLWDSYGQDDKPLFFGRDRETKILYDKTFASNLLLLYGPSGAGKTSLIRCGLGNMFEDSDWYPILIRKGDNILKSLSVALRKATEDPEKLRNNSIREKIHHLFLEKFRPIFLIFDQFEELFILGSHREQDQFFRLLMDLLEVNFQCKIILSIKEDYLADLDRYEEAIPVLFYNRMRVERMRTEQLEEVIRGITKSLGIQIESPEDSPAEEEEIIGDILGKVRDDTHRVDLGELQIFMDELYARDEGRLKREDGKARPIRFDRPLVQNTEYVDTVIAQRLQKQLEDLDQKFKRIADIERLPYHVLKFLVTEVETKQMRTVEETAQHLFKKHQIAPAYVRQCIEALIKTGLLKNLSHLEQGKEKIVASLKDKVEIVHDNLAKKLYPLLFSEERNIIKIKNFILIQYETYREAGVMLSKEDLEYIQPYLHQIKEEIPEDHQRFIKKSQRESKERELRWAMFLAIVIIFLALSSAFAFLQWSRSSSQSKANRISARALDALSYDRTLALRRAEMALQTDSHNTLANDVLNDVLLSSWKFPFYQEVIKIEGGDIDRISDLEVSKYNHYLLAGSLDGQIFIRDLRTSRADESLTAIKDRHNQEVTDVDFLDKYPDEGYYFITASKDSTARLWEIVGVSEADLKSTFNHREPLSAVYMAFTAQDTLVITAGDKQIKLWNYDQPREPSDSFPAPQTTAFEFVERGGRPFLFVAGQDSKLRFINIDIKKDTFTYAIPEGTITNMDFSGNKLAAGLENGHLVIWEIDDSFFDTFSSKRTKQMESFLSKQAHAETIKDIVFLQNGTQILTSSEDKSAKLWDAQVRLLKTFLGHNDGVRTITYAQFESYDSFVLTGGEDQTIKKWRLDLPVYTPTSLPEITGRITAIDFTPAGEKLLVCQNEHKLFLYEKDNRGDYSVQKPIPIPNTPEISDIAISRDGELILVALAGSGTAQLWNDNGNMLGSFQHDFGNEEKGAVSDVVFYQHENEDGDKDYQYILTTGGKTNCLWQRGIDPDSPESFILKRTFNHKSPVTTAIITTDNNISDDPILLTITLDDNKAYLWKTFDRPDTINHKDVVLSAAFSIDGRYFLTGNQDNSFTLMDIGLRNTFRIQRHDADVHYVAFCKFKEPENNNIPGFNSRSTSEQFLSAGEDGIVRLWYFDGKEVTEQKSIINHGGPIVEAFFLSETKILTYGTDRQIKIWDTSQIEDFIEKDIFQLSEEE